MAIALLCVAAAIPVARFGIALAIYRGRPDLAASYAPFMSRALSGEAERVFGDGQDPERRKHAAELGLQALRRDSTNVSALATLGFVTDVAGDRTRARNLFINSERLSRRDLRTQLWLIEAEVARNDIPSVLRHYDTAMRTSPAARQTLFPILAGAITEPGIRTELVRRLAARPNWGESFLVHAAISGPDLGSAARLLQSSAAAKIDVPQQAWAALISRLVDATQYDQAWSTYQIVRRGASSLDFRFPDFRQQLDFTTPFDWVLNENSEVTAELNAGADGGLGISASATTGGDFVQQLQLLPPGRYALSGSVRYESGMPAVLPYWRISCLNGTELGRIALRPTASGRYSGEFSVPAACRAQVITLTLDPSSEGEAMSGIVHDVHVARLPKQ